MAEGRELTTRARAIDVAPTLLDLLGVEAPERFQGRSLASLLTPGATMDPLPALIETDLFPYPWLYEIVTVDRDTGDIALEPEWEDEVQRAKHRGLYFGRWKLLELPTLQGLRVEEVSAAHPDVVADLRALLQRERSWAAP
ncbi:hypothetical protein JQX13_43430 [Archangium violaceum]|uniref:hypothetical protein n=1 Tax=Archangium violaceum TaxID=83451 RepID=UPI00193C5050|nr:hypothetical protein [Archangium violaceum]QRK06847.1 hypothetical protein JQX13_43430 [Archangium violaceum]